MLFNGPIPTRRDFLQGAFDQFVLAGEMIGDQAGTDLGSLGDLGKARSPKADVGQGFNRRRDDLGPTRAFDKGERRG